VADVAAPVIVTPAPAALPPPRHKGRAEPGTVAGEAKPKSGFPAFLLAVLIAAGLLVLIGSQLGPWRLPGSPPAEASEHQAAAPKVEAPPSAVTPVTAPAPPPVVAPGLLAPGLVATGLVATGSTLGQAQGDAKPSPVGPQVTQADPGAAPSVKPGPEAVGLPSPPARKTDPQRPAAPQEVSVMSSPGGALATLDGNPSTACSTPCALRAAPGRHALSFVLRGHQIERREFTVGEGPLELPPVVLQRAGGTLMLSSDPPGAAISVDGKRIDQVTPAQIPLAQGIYSIMIEKGGRQATEQVEVKGGITTRRIILGQ
jgi:hypothetical protein